MAAALAALAASTALTVAPLAGQVSQRIIRIAPGSVVTGVVELEGGVPAELAAQQAAAAGAATAADGTAAAAAPAKTPAQERLEKFLQLRFDRRPSAVLKAWGIPEAPEPASQQGSPPTSGVAAEPAGPPDPAAAQTAAIAAEMEAFAKSVTLGRWDEVAAFFGDEEKFEADGRAKAYQHLLASLGQPAQQQPPQPGAQPVNPQFAEQNAFLPDDVIGLADAAPDLLSDDALTALGALMQRALEGGSFSDALVARLAGGTRRLGGDDPANRRAAAKLLIRAGRAPLAGAFLPEAAAAADDAEALDLLAQFHLAQGFGKDGEEHLETAWEVTRRLLELDGAPGPLRSDALARAVDLAPQVRDDLGQAWLHQSFAADPERGMEVLAAIGSAAAAARGQQDPEFRRRKLALQSTAVAGLLESAPDRAAEWAGPLNLLASSWLTEAEFSYQYDQSVGSGAEVRYDRYGNMFFDEDPYRYQQMMNQGNRMPQPVPTLEVLKLAPGEGWLKQLDPSLAPRVDLVTARLYLKAKDEENSFPHLERIASVYPEPARELADEFIRVWAENHDPNADRRRTNPYFYYYGYSERADAIPLTRSKQARNLEDLAGWVEKLGGGIL